MQSRLISVLLLFLSFGFFVYVLSLPKISTIPSPSSANENSVFNYLGEFTVSRVVDGDTIHVLDNKGREQIVRMLVVNTPELHKDTKRNICLGEISKSFAKENLENKKVYLYGDKTQPVLDKYLRTLAYIATTSNFTEFFNDELMRQGYAKVYKASPPGTLYKQYVELENKAKAEKLIMWNPELCK